MNWRLGETSPHSHVGIQALILKLFISLVAQDLNCGKLDLPSLLWLAGSSSPPGIELRSPALGVQSLTTGPPGKSQNPGFKSQCMTSGSFWKLTSSQHTGNEWRLKPNVTPARFFFFLEVGSYVLFGGNFKGFKPGRQHLKSPWENWSEEVGQGGGS